MLTAIASILLAAAACAKSPAADGNGDRQKENHVADVKDSPGGGGGGQATPADPREAAYAALVPRRQPADKIKEYELYRVGEWRFFQLQNDSSGHPRFSARAAVDGKGHVVAPRLTGDSAWHAFLTTSGLDAAGALERIAWLNEAAPVSKSGDHAPVSDPKAQALVADPVIEKTKAGVRFVGWFARPPDFDPWRTTIEAPAAGTAKVTDEMWHKLPPR